MRFKGESVGGPGSELVKYVLRNCCSLRGDIKLSQPGKHGVMPEGNNSVLSSQQKGLLMGKAHP